MREKEGDEGLGHRNRADRDRDREKQDGGGASSVQTEEAGGEDGGRVEQHRGERSSTGRMARRELKVGLSEGNRETEDAGRQTTAAARLPEPGPSERQGLGSGDACERDRQRSIQGGLGKRQ